MRADPEPVVITVTLASQGTITATDLNRVDRAFLAKAQRWMPRIRLKQGELLVRELLNVCGKLLVALPE